MQLVFEHLKPRRLLIHEMFLLADELDPEALSELLHRRITAAVITRSEDLQVTKAGLGNQLPEHSTGPWSRYQAAGLDVEEFAPLQLT